MSKAGGVAPPASVFPGAVRGRQVGTVEPGRYADLVEVRGDPIADITELERVPWVMKGGKVFKNELTR